MTVKRAVSAVTLTVALLILAGLISRPALSDPQISKVVTFTTGTAIRVTTDHVRINSLFIQMLHGGSNIGYVLFADPGTTCSQSTVGQMVAELAPATSTAPGGSFSFPSNGTAQTSSGGTEANFWCVQGSTGDTAVISYNVRN